MSIEIEWPVDLSPQMTVLFIKPYSPEDSEHLSMSGGGKNELKDLFEKISIEDPGLNNYLDTVDTIRIKEGLKGYIIGDDLTMLYGGSIETLKSAERQLNDRYTCIIDKLGSFMNFVEDAEDNTVVIPNEPPTIN